MRRLATLLIATTLALGAQAQDNKASKEREALRRAQAALRTAQEQQSTLSADKAKAEAAAASAQKDAAAAKAQIGSTAAKLRAREKEVEALQAQTQDLRDKLAQAQAAQGQAQEREQRLLQQLAAARQESAGRLQASQSLSALLEKSTSALADAETKNQQLYAIGQDLVKRWQSRSFFETALLNDPVAGLSAIRLEDEAEKLRAELAQRKLVR